MRREKSAEALFVRIRSLVEYFLLCTHDKKSNEGTGRVTTETPAARSGYVTIYLIYTIQIFLRP